MKSLFMLSLLITINTHAQESRLDTLGKSMQSIKKRNQINHICYAHAASDIIDSYRAISNDKRAFRTSPLALAIQSSQNINYKRKDKKPSPYIFEFGQICNAIQTGFSEGVRDFKDVDAAIYQLTIPNANLETMSIEKKEDYRNNFNQYFNHLHQGWSNQNSNISYLQYLQWWLKSKSPRSFSISTQARKTPRCRVLKLSSNFFLKKDAEVYYKLSNHFKQKNALPIGLDFCERYLVNGEIGRVNEKTPSGESCIRHAVTIIGIRTLKDNSQEILLKNSNPCHFISKQFECNDNKVWAPMIPLVKSSMSIHYLDLPIF